MYNYIGKRIEINLRGIYTGNYVLAGHRCSEKGCGTAIVLDGNMRNHRDVCAAREAGYAEFSGLPGNVKTGCTNTPQLKSRYCPAHTHTAFTPEGDNSSETTPLSTVAMREHQVAYIVNKRTTRQTIFYEVQFENT